MPLKQMNLLARRINHFFLPSDSRLSTRLAAKIQKPKRKQRRKQSKPSLPPTLAQRMIADFIHELPPPPQTPMHDASAARPETPTFVPENYRPFLFLNHQNSMELHKATYTGYISRRDEPAPDMHPDDPRAALYATTKYVIKYASKEVDSIPELPGEKIALDAGGGKKMRHLAKLGLGFADAARSHEDNITPQEAAFHEKEIAFWEAEEAEQDSFWQLLYNVAQQPAA